MVKVEEYDLPDDLYYHEEHCWVKIEDGKVRIGFDDFTQKLAGKMKRISLPFEGDELQQDQPIGTIESGKWVGKIIAPVSGVVVQVNEKMEETPWLINDDPYGQGWIAVVEPSKLQEELPKLHYKEKAVEWTKREIKEHVKK